MIKRQLQLIIQGMLFKGKAILIFGPRQVGKTTLLKSIDKNYDQVLWLNGDEPVVQEFFQNYTSLRLQAYLGRSKYMIIDEAQRIENVGLKLKIINYPGNEKERLKLLSDSYLYKDVLIWEQIHKPDKLTKFLQALAYQVGSQVSYHELA
jgi:predicted AAA+ superfamily ATPase